ncbi:hypothetical protein H6G94_35500 [Nostoc punctiforme FACHB-252]|uniref:CopG family transcriptional regulator n=1 Tax=Nostoc punctiforme FACHB-252 TaxID=1357509 RepID=A0ABR8HMN7_NOSPU|nr:hypothetical protein [Nostoc punctiforme]MBD2616469.1 hypothetical protein [Nostoc punctiforme FACHB-252]
MMIPVNSNLPQSSLLLQNTVELYLDFDEAQIIDNYCQQTGYTYDEVIQQLVQQFLDLQEST